jgi:hypothetical protein
MVRPRRSISASYPTKKNARFNVIGPPTVPPNWFRWKSGFSSTSKKLRASMASLRWNSNALPDNWFEPDFVSTFTWPPEFLPNSAL